MHKLRDKIFFSIILGFTLGIFVRSFVEIDFVLVLCALVVVFGLLGISLTTKKPLIGLFALALLAGNVGVLRYSQKDVKPNEILVSLEGQQATLKGEIVRDPDRREKSAFITVALDEVNDYTFEKGKPLVRIRTELFPQLFYKDSVAVEGKITRPESFLTDSGREFDYASYLGKDEIYFEVSFAKLITYEHEPSLVGLLYATKQGLEHEMKKVVPEPKASLLAGILLGSKKGLGSELEEKFRKTGVIHMVVLSGYNITVVAEFLQKIFSFLPKMFGLASGALGIIIFAILTGAQATVIRASIMALLVLFARGTGRTYNVTRALVFAGFLMILHNPKILVYDYSFQLSFLATIGLIYFSPLVERKLMWIRPPKLRDIVVSTVATQFFVLPMILYRIGDLSTVALLVNILVLAFVPAAMLLGFVSTMASFISFSVALPFAYITALILEYMIRVVSFFSAFSFASLTISYFPVWLLMAVYFLYAVLLIKFFPISQKIDVKAALSSKEHNSASLNEE